MLKKVKFILRSNLMIGGTKTNNNFLVSEDFITGKVLRAAFAWSILNECPFAEEVYENKKYFVTYRGEKCGNCPNAEKCKKFSNMRFSFFYPENSVPAPFTLRECKAYGTKHPLKDTIAENGRLSCEGTLENGNACTGRMESVKGYINPETHQKVKLSRTNSTHTAIDEYTHTALESSLFSVNSIAKDQIYEGYIDDCGTDMATNGQVIYCGKYSSCGFGKMEIIEAISAAEKNCSKAVKIFNDKFGAALSEKYGKDKMFAAVLFISDANLGLEEFNDSYAKSSEDYRKEWENRIFGENSPIKLEQIYAQNFIYAGYDTSRTDGMYGIQKSPCILTEKGTSLLISFDRKNLQTAVDYLNALTQSGIGKETEIGYGQIEICNSLHLIGVGKND